MTRKHPAPASPPFEMKTAQVPCLHSLVLYLYPKQFPLFSTSLSKRIRQPPVPYYTTYFSAASVGKDKVHHGKVAQILLAQGHFDVAVVSLGNLFELGFKRARHLRWIKRGKREEEENEVERAQERWKKCVESSKRSRQKKRLKMHTNNLVQY